MEEALTIPHTHPNTGPRWWETLGSLRISLLRLDGEQAAIVNAEKHAIIPVVISSEVAGALKRIAQQFGAGSGAVGQSGGTFGFETVKSGFTREAGSSRRQVSPPEVREPGE